MTKTFSLIIYNCFKVSCSVIGFIIVSINIFSSKLLFILFLYIDSVCKKIKSCQSNLTNVQQALEATATFKINKIGKKIRYIVSYKLYLTILKDLKSIGLTMETTQRSCRPSQVEIPCSRLKHLQAQRGLGERESLFNP